MYMYLYNPFLVYCRELAPGTVSLTGDRAKGDYSKHDSHYTTKIQMHLETNTTNPDQTTPQEAVSS